MHQNRETLFCPGSPTTDVTKIAEKILGKRFTNKLQKFGHVTDVIIKPGEVVTLLINIYRLEIPETYTVRLPEKFSWYTKDQLESDPRGKRDKRLYLRLLENKPLNVEYSEEQLEDWIDAKILYWREA